MIKLIGSIFSEFLLIEESIQSKYLRTPNCNIIVILVSKLKMMVSFEDYSLSEIIQRQCLCAQNISRQKHGNLTLINLNFCFFDYLKKNILIKLKK